MQIDNNWPWASFSLLFSLFLSFSLFFSLFLSFSLIFSFFLFFLYYIHDSVCLLLVSFSRSVPPVIINMGLHSPPPSFWTMLKNTALLVCDGFPFSMLIMMEVMVIMTMMIFFMKHRQRRNLLILSCSTRIVDSWLFKDQNSWFYSNRESTFWTTHDILEKYIPILLIRNNKMGHRINKMGTHFNKVGHRNSKGGHRNNKVGV